MNTPLDLGLSGTGPEAAAEVSPTATSTELVVRVRPDVAAIDREFDYLVPAKWVDRVQVGTMVRIALGPRRVGGWVVAVGVTPPDGVALSPIAKVRGHGPSEEVIELAHWAAKRWAGPVARFLTTASPARAVVSLQKHSADGSSVGETVSPFDTAGTRLVRLAPGSDRWPLIQQAVSAAEAKGGNALVLAPDYTTANALVRRLRDSGTSVAAMPDQWARAAAGATVVGTRSAAWAPVANLAAVVVLDEHDEAYQEESAPTWHAREVAIERARRAVAPCVLVSPTPSLEALDAAGSSGLHVSSRSAEAAGWPKVTIVDQRQQDTVRSGLYSPPMLRAIDGDGDGHQPTTICVLNRKGRARLMVCVGCDTVLTCEACDGGVRMVDADKSSATALGCGRCDTRRPAICNHCGKTQLKALRVGVAKIAEELETLLRTQIVEVTGESAGQPLPRARVYVGTEAALHQVPAADLVVFLDIDQELLAPRYRAAEQAMALVSRAARLVGGRGGATRGRPGHIVFQTRLPNHEVLQAALRGAPELVADAELARRQVLQFPPVTAMAAISGASAERFVEALPNPLPDGVVAMGPNDGMWLLRAPNHEVLAAVLADTPRPGGRLRVAVDPLRV